MARIRAIVVDDSIVVRHLVSDLLAADPEIAVVGTAADGKSALTRIAQLAPDVVTLDIEMPVLDGISALRELRKTHPRLPVIMFSTLTEAGAQSTLDALAAGANDFVCKPSNLGSVTRSIERIKDELIPRIKSLVQHQSARPTTSASRPAPRPVVSARTSRIDVVLIGVSTGGPNALAEVLPRLPARLPVPVLIVQHMPAMFTRLLAERLASSSQLRVREARSGERVAAGEALLAPGDWHMRVVRNASGLGVELDQGPAENFCRPAVDVLFRSAAELGGLGTLAVVLTGMGHDGLHGVARLREGGGTVIAQDQASSVVWGMPGAVVGAGLVDEVLPLNEIAQAIERRVTQSRGGAIHAAPDRRAG